MNFTPLKRALLLITALLFSTLAMAGQPCDNKPPEAWRTARGLAMAEQLNSTLNSRSDLVALVARAGSDVSKYGLRYTHVGLAYRRDLASPWTVLHKLNECGTDHSTIYRQGLGNFFLDNPYEYRALVVWLKPEVAATVLASVDNESRIRTVDQRRYSLLAYPFATETQNSNGWLLEFLALTTSPEPLYNRREVQARLRATQYQADSIHISPTERLGASFTKANISFLDHPLSQRLAGDYRTVTAESLVRWVDRQGWIAAQTEISRQLSR